MGRRGFLAVSALAGSGVGAGLCAAVRRAVNSRPAPAGQALEGGGFKPNAFIRISPEGGGDPRVQADGSGPGREDLAADGCWPKSWNSTGRTWVVEQGDLDARLWQPVQRRQHLDPEELPAVSRAGRHSAQHARHRPRHKPGGCPEHECHAGTERRAPPGLGPLAGLWRPRLAGCDPARCRRGRAVKLKNPKEFKLLGTRVGGVDNDKIVSGAPLFGIDLHLPGMRYAVYEKCPGLRWARCSVPTSTRSRPCRVLCAMRSCSRASAVCWACCPALAIVADSTWGAFSARKKLKVQWAEGATASQSWARLCCAGRAESPSNPPAPCSARTAMWPGALASAPRSVSRPGTATPSSPTRPWSAAELQPRRSRLA